MKFKMQKFLILTVILLLSVCKSKPAECPLCNRQIHEHMQVAITHHHIPLKTCCMACALTFKAQEKDVEIVSATDFNTNTPIAPDRAFYVVDSDISPCLQDRNVNKVIREPHETLYACFDRCSPGILAFKSKESADTFRQDHGGKPATYGELPMLIMARGGHHHD